MAFITESGPPHEHVSTEQHLTYKDWTTTFLSIQTPTENTFHSTPLWRPDPLSPPRTSHLHHYLPDHPPLCICQDLVPAIPPRQSQDAFVLPAPCLGSPPPLPALSLSNVSYWTSPCPVSTSAKWKWYFISMAFPTVMYGFKSWTIKKAESWRINASELWCWRRLFR